MDDRFWTELSVHVSVQLHQVRDRAMEAYVWVFDKAHGAEIINYVAQAQGVGEIAQLGAAGLVAAIGEAPEVLDMLTERNREFFKDIDTRLSHDMESLRADREAEAAELGPEGQRESVRTHIANSRQEGLAAALDQARQARGRERD